jgi:hypothetical protein
MAVERDVAAVRRGETEAEAKRRCLAGTVRAEQAKAGAGFDGERQPGDDVGAAISLAQQAGVSVAMRG